MVRFNVLAVLFIGGIAASAILSGAEPSSREGKPDVVVIDPVRALSVEGAAELEGEIQRAAAKLSTSVVRLWSHNEAGTAFDEQGQPVMGGCSGVIIDRSGMILTCSHHGQPPGAKVTIELSEGKRAAGQFLGRFNLDDPRPLHFGHDLGLAKITDLGEWPAATVSFQDPPSAGELCLAIGYPGTLRPGCPPLLRLGRILPRFPGIPKLETTTTLVSGDSGGPLFDRDGRVIGVLSGGDSVAPAKYQPVSALKEFRDRLEAGELVSAAEQYQRVTRSRPAQPAAFVPQPDLETQILQRQSRGIIHIMNGPHLVAAGLIFDADGWAVTKASLVGSRHDWLCRLHYLAGKAIVNAQVMATSAEHDVALLKVDVHNWQGVEWSNERSRIGTIVCSPLGRSSGPLQFAVVGAETCEEPFLTGGAAPQIGISVLSDEQGRAIFEKVWDSAEGDCYRDLFQQGDVLTYLNGIETPTSGEFVRVWDRIIYAVDAKTGEATGSPAPGSYHGDWVSIGILRGEEKLTVHIPKIHSVTQNGLDGHSNPLSLRREGFPAVFAHDGELRPEQCGGPVVDLSGRVIGLNIARADTTRTLAIPADILQQVIADLKKKAKMQPETPER